MTATMITSKAVPSVITMMVRTGIGVATKTSHRRVRNGAVDGGEAIGMNEYMLEPFWLEGAGQQHKDGCQMFAPAQRGAMGIG